MTTILDGADDQDNDGIVSLRPDNQSGGFSHAEPVTPARRAMTRRHASAILLDVNIVSSDSLIAGRSLLVGDAERDTSTGIEFASAEHAVLTRDLLAGDCLSIPECSAAGHEP